MIIMTDEIQKNEELSIVEKVVLSIYKNYTEKGKYKCCTLTNAQIADELKISKHYIKKIRNHLEDLGYISAKGIKVVYLGKTDTIVSLKTDTIVSGVDTIVSLKGTPEYPLKKEKEEIKKEEIKEEIKEGTTKFDQIMSLLPVRHHTPEKEEYLKNKYGDKIDNINLDTPGTKDVVKINLTNELDDKFPPIFQSPVKEEEEEQKIDYTNYDE